MADSREPPPLFNDDDDSHKDDDNDDLFTSAVQSPVSELTTPEEPRRQEGLGDPLTSPSPAASPTPDPPSDSHAGNPTDLFESVGEPPVGGLSSVSLESPTGGEGTQQVSYEAQDPALLHLASSSSPGSLTTAQEHVTSSSETSSSADPLSLLISPTNIQEIPALASPFSSLLTTFPQDTISPSIVEDSSLDFNFGPSLVSEQEHSSEPHRSPLKDSWIDTQDPFSQDPEPQHKIVDSLTHDNVDNLHTQGIFSSPPPKPVPIIDVPEPVVSSSSVPINDSISLSTSNAVLGTTASPQLSSFNDILLDLGMNLPQELPSDPDTTLVDAPCVESANMSSFDAPVEDAGTTGVTGSDDVVGTAESVDQSSPPANSTSDSVPATSEVLIESSVATQELADTDLSLHDSPTFLGDGDTTEICLDDNAKVWRTVKSHGLCGKIVQLYIVLCFTYFYGFSCA